MRINESEMLRYAHRFSSEIIVYAICFVHFGCSKANKLLDGFQALFVKKNSIFSNFCLMLEDLQKFWTSNFLDFLIKRNLSDPRNLFVTVSPTFEKVSNQCKDP